MSLSSVACPNILHAIGNTPIVKLNAVTSGLAANVYVKCEYMNPGGSTKDRIAVHMIDVAEKQGLLKPGGTIVEPTSGNTGLGLALVAAARGYKCIFVLADKQSEEKRRALRATGAQVVICPTDVAADDPRSYYCVSERIARETPNSYYPNQYQNPSNIEAHYLSTGPEIWRQCVEELDVFICSIGTGGTVTGIARYLKEQNPNIQIVGVDPVGSIYYDLFHTGKPSIPHTYYVEGIGEDFMPGTMDLHCMNDIVQVTDRESFMMGRRLIREEGLLCGGSSGAAVAGAVKYIQSRLRWSKERLPNILVMLPDASSRYLSKFLNDEWLRDAGMLEHEPIPGQVQDIMQRKESLYTADFDEPLGNVVDRMRQHGISQLPVLRDGELCGVANEVRILDALVNGKAAMNSPIGPVADSASVMVVTPQSHLAQLADAFTAGKVAVVCEGKQVIGMLTKIDLITHLATKTHL